MYDTKYHNWLKIFNIINIWFDTIKTSNITTYTNIIDNNRIETITINTNNLWYTLIQYDT